MPVKEAQTWSPESLNSPDKCHRYASPCSLPFSLPGEAIQKPTTRSVKTEKPKGLTTPLIEHCPQQSLEQTVIQPGLDENGERGANQLPPHRNVSAFQGNPSLYQNVLCYRHFIFQ